MIVIGGNINGYSKSVEAIIDRRDTKAAQELAIRQVDAGRKLSTSMRGLAGVMPLS